MSKKKISLQVKGMSCEHCVQSVTQALEALDGISKVKVRLKRARADVQYDPDRVTPDAMIEAITNAGYEADVA